MINAVAPGSGAGSRETCPGRPSGVTHSICAPQFIRAGFFDRSLESEDLLSLAQTVGMASRADIPTIAPPLKQIFEENRIIAIFQKLRSGQFP